ncbi:MAG: hypothetical protein FJ320_08795 [SAR202 cluster bacterium]|nr:hypothetical protein [SAR202 cluster bacterium]
MHSGATLTVNNSQFNGNMGAGGNGGHSYCCGGAAGGIGVGGAVFNNGGTANISGSAFCNNAANQDPDTHNANSVTNSVACILFDIETAVAAVEAKLDNLDFSGLASQTSVDNLSTQVQLLNQQVTTVNSNISNLQNTTDQIQTMVSNLHVSVDALEAKLDSLDAQINSLNSQFDAFDVDVRGALLAMSNAANAHYTQFNSFDAEVRATLAIFGDVLAALEAKLDALDNTINNHTTNAVNAAVGAINSNTNTAVSNAANSINSNTNMAVGNAANSINGNIDNLDAAVAALEAKLDALDNTINNHTTNAVNAAVASINNNTSTAVGSATTAINNNTSTAVGNAANSINNNINDVDAAVAALEAKLDAMEEQNQDTAGFFQSLVNSVLETRDVDVRVVELKNKSRYLLVTTEDGKAVNATIVSVFAAAPKNNQPLSFVNVTGNTTSSSAGTGRLYVNINLPNGIKDASIFEFTVRHDDVDPVLGTVSHYGVAVFEIKGGGND